MKLYQRRRKNCMNKIEFENIDHSDLPLSSQCQRGFHYHEQKHNWPAKQLKMLKMFLSSITSMLKKTSITDNLKSWSFLKIHREGNRLTVSMGHEANATGVPPYVNTSDPFTWYHHNKLSGKIFIKRVLILPTGINLLLISTTRKNASVCPNAE